MNKELLERTGLFEENRHGQMVAGDDRLSVGVDILPHYTAVYMYVNDFEIHIDSIRTLAQLYSFTTQLLRLDDRITEEKLSTAFKTEQLTDGMVCFSVSDRNEEVRIVVDGSCEEVVLLGVETVRKVDISNINTMSDLLNLCERSGLGHMLYTGSCDDYVSLPTSSMVVNVEKAVVTTKQLDDFLSSLQEHTDNEEIDTMTANEIRSRYLKKLGFVDVVSKDKNRRFVLKVDNTEISVSDNGELNIKAEIDKFDMGNIDLLCYLLTNND